jgi:hypothetical protein
MADVGLYLNLLTPWRSQKVDRTQPGLPLKPGRCGAMNRASSVLARRRYSRDSMCWKARFCHISRRLQCVARPEPSDYAICMMPIAMRAC